MRLPWTSTSPPYGRSPLPSKMRALVNSTSAIEVSFRSALRRQEVAQLARAVVGTLDRRPVTAAVQDRDAHPFHPLGHRAHRLRRRDDVLVAGDEQGRRLDAIDG